VHGTVSSYDSTLLGTLRVHSGSGPRRLVSLTDYLAIYGLISSMHVFYHWQHFQLLVRQYLYFILIAQEANFGIATFNNR